ncbi:MAG: hypothetical protein KC457_17435, partial [Myxococcales bacterium]|nr:hypothetical protein [Myxococcales bacterium]
MSTRPSCHRPAAALAAGVCLLAGLMLVAAPAGAAPPDSPADSPPDAAPELIPPRPLGPLRYDYPPELLERDEPPAGTVTVQYVVGVDGVPKEITLLEGLDPRLD